MGSDILTMNGLNISVRQPLLWSDYQDSEIQVKHISNNLLKRTCLKITCHHLNLIELYDKKNKKPSKYFRNLFFERIL